LTFHRSGRTMRLHEAAVVRDFITAMEGTHP